MRKDFKQSILFFMIFRKACDRMWLMAAIFSAFLGGITAILAKCGIKDTDSDVATALRTIVVLIFSWIMVFVAGSIRTIPTISPKSFFFLALSGIATGASWICYFKALSLGDINKVMPIDKSSTVLSVVLAILLFHETDHLAIKLAGTTILAIGIFLMIQKKEVAGKQGKNSQWMLYAVCSAVFAALTSIFAKIGITDVESNLGTAIRTCFVLIMAWFIVFAKGKQGQIKHINRRELGFITLSGLATGASWLFYYYAIQNGVVSVVVPIDKLSIVVTVVFSYIVFNEKLSAKAFAGLCLMVVGTFVMAIWA